MKVTLIGKGKTGSQVQQLLPPDSLLATFDSSTPLDILTINHSDVCIVFIPGPAFVSLLPQLLQATTPMVIGATGFSWQPEHLEQLVREQKKWIHGHNFSLAMNVVRHLLAVIGRARGPLARMQFHLHEAHHHGKLDSPSGTALKWREWLDLPEVKISSQRQDDIIGLHQLTVTGTMEQLQITHQALDRKLFACGALWAAQRVTGDPPSLRFGLTSFEALVDQYMTQENP